MTTTQGRRDQFRQPSRGVPGWIPLGGPASRPTGRSPPGSRKNFQTTCGPPPFSGLARVANVGDVGQGPAAGPARSAGRAHPEDRGGQWTTTPNSSAYVPPGLPSPSDSGTEADTP